MAEHKKGLEGIVERLLRQNFPSYQFTNAERKEGAVYVDCILNDDSVLKMKFSEKELAYKELSDIAIRDYPQICTPTNPLPIGD
jgi:hypothetical protein